MSSESFPILKQYIIVIFTGIFCGIIFLFSPMSAGDEKQILSTLAAVQGSFLAIFVSVFLLSLQVTASEFSPLAIDSLKNEKTINSIIVLFISSIILDLYYISTNTNPIYNFRTNLNVEVGVAVALATISLLSLIPTKNLMSSLVSSNQILKRAEQNVSSDDISEYNLVNIDKPPQRTKLLLIEQIFRSANERKDAYTMQYAMHSLNGGICKIISELTSADEINDHALFGHWDRCQDTISSEEPSKIRLLNSGNKKIVVSLIKNKLTDKVDERLTEWKNSVRKVFDSEFFESQLISDFYSVAEYSNRTSHFSISEKIISQLHQLSDAVFDISGSPEDASLSGERRDVLIKIIENCIEITSSELPDDPNELEINKRRSLAKRAKTTVDEILERVLSSEEQIEVPEAALQNIENSAAKQFLISSILLSKYDEIISVNFLLCFSELVSQEDTSIDSRFDSITHNPHPKYIQIIEKAITKLDSDYKQKIESIENVDISKVQNNLNNLYDEIDN